ncbi:MAG: hypothetical protein A2X12_09395 [Bacteroidetes bacterium GWE2_29_8]|nr:MAG: hypothetical protein A2X12_09395 [Bacteroidetes bacterium GWE2_29_8]OFY17984.1 MAG: hypothetical protein A2X02_04930 [Bacteroidetes bacterium GWF2_29_10]
MKKINNVILISLVMLICISAKKLKENQDPFIVKEVEKEVVKLNDKVYISKFEVSNKQYMAFINDLTRKGEQATLKIARIDTMGWIARNSYNDPYVSLYHKHPSYRDYPVVNISYQGAVLFCKWLTEQYNSIPNKKFNKVKFRLPTEKEWETAARGSSDTTINFAFSLFSKKGPTANYVYISQESICVNTSNSNYFDNVKIISNDYVCKKGQLSFNADVTAPVKAYYPNGYGIYNTHGNVEEMIEGGTKTKGGSWHDTGYNLQINISKPNNAPNDMTGFRFVMEIE